MEMIANGHNKFFPMDSDCIWHKTSDKLIPFLMKRYRYARDLYSDRQNRRWKIIDETIDYWRLLGFVLSTLTVIPCLYLSIKGFSKIRDRAWFWHYPVCLGFLITYTALAIRNLFKHGRLFQCRSEASSFQRLAAPTA